MSLLALYYHVDEFWQGFAPLWRRLQLVSGLRRRERAGQMSVSEMMTILILFHDLRYRDCKTYYTRHVQVARRVPHSAQLQPLYRASADGPRAAVRRSAERPGRL